MVKYCSDCGTEIEDIDQFCKSCGKQVSVKKIEAKKEVTPFTRKVDNKPHNPALFWAIGVIVVVFFAGLYLFTPETRSIQYQLSYQDPIYRTDFYQDPVYGTFYKGFVTGQSSASFDRAKYAECSPGFLAGTYTCDVDGSLYHWVTSYSITPYSAVDHYDTKSRQVLDHYDTKYRTEYTSVTKTRLEWIIGV